MLTTRLKEIAERESKATKEFSGWCSDLTGADRAFLTSVRADIPYLLSRLEIAVRGLREIVDKCHSSGDCMTLKAVGIANRALEEMDRE